MLSQNRLIAAGFILAATLAIFGVAAYLLLAPTQPSPNQAADLLEIPSDSTTQVTITEFADFNCRYCAEFALAYYPRLKQDFLHHPTVNFEFRHYPFLHESSWTAALAYECLKDQDRHEQFHDLAFEQHLNPDGPDFSTVALTGPHPYSVRS